FDAQNAEPSCMIASGVGPAWPPSAWDCAGVVVNFSPILCRPPARSCEAYSALVMGDDYSAKCGVGRLQFPSTGVACRVKPSGLHPARNDGQAAGPEGQVRNARTSDSRISPG